MKRLFLLLLLIRPAFGQVVDSTTVTSSFPEKSNFKSGLFLSYGYTPLALTYLPAIRMFFQENAIKADSRSSNYFNYAFGYRHKRTKVMLEYAFGVNDQSLPSTDPVTTRYVARRQSTGNVGFLLGYDVANTRNQRLFINAGIGTFRYEYSIYQLTSQPVAFQNILQYSPPGSVPSLVLNNGYWDVSIEVVQREKQKKGLQIDSRIGYRRGLQADAWTSDAYQLTGAPTDRISQFYAQLNINFSYNYSRLRQK